MMRTMRCLLIAAAALTALPLGAAFAPIPLHTAVGPAKSANPSPLLSLRCKAQEAEGSKGSSRRNLFGSSAAALAAAALGAAPLAPRSAEAASAGPKQDDAWWQAKIKSGELSPRAYQVLHNADTERPRTSPLLKEGREGTFACAACKTPLFDSGTKFDSGTGWPSFYDKLPGVELETGNTWDNVVALRSEVHCVTCGGHLGHVFDDGAVWRVPTGKRYCINGLALSFQPKA